jgi:murein DD-endopeptidase MepM/ murein hydrolase activator NlpD
MALATTGALALAAIGGPAMATVASGAGRQTAAAVATRTAQGGAKTSAGRVSSDRAAARKYAATVKQAAAVAAPGRAQWSAPVPGASLSEAYGVADSQYAAGYHTGTDFAVDSGTAVVAVGDGTVVSAGRRTSYGNTVVVRLSDGRYALYAHLSAFEVTAGQQVRAGDRLGLSGSTGNSTGPHLHFEIRTSDVYGADVDPLAYLRAKGVGDF